MPEQTPEHVCAAIGGAQFELEHALSDTIRRRPKSWLALQLADTLFEVEGILARIAKDE